MKQIFYTYPPKQSHIRCRCRGHSQVEGDLCCNVHLQSMKLSASVTDDDIIYANFKEAVWSQPYSIIVDHFKKNVVLSFRGTFSPQDFLTDGLAVNIPLDRYGKGIKELYIILQFNSSYEYVYDC
jgi:hypothetical protein